MAGKRARHKHATVSRLKSEAGRWSKQELRRENSTQEIETDACGKINRRPGAALEGARVGRTCGTVPGRDGPGGPVWPSEKTASAV